MPVRPSPRESERIDWGRQRAQSLGFPNTYAYTKSLAERLLLTHYPETTILRPSIVESAVEHPFPGWNEGYNTCAPLTYLAGTMFHHVPARRGNPFDVVPVDMLCRAILTVTAAELAGIHNRVVQCGTSDSNPLTVDRVIDLTSLAHRKHRRTEGEPTVANALLARWDAVDSGPDDILATPRVRQLVRGVRTLVGEVQKKAPGDLRKTLVRRARSLRRSEHTLRRIEAALDLFTPFTHDYRYTFESRVLRELDIAEPEYRFEPQSISWRDYWIDIQVPGLRRWCFPHLEGKDAEPYAAPHRLHLNRDTRRRAS